MIDDVDLEPLAAPAYIGAVLLNGTPVDLDRVLASVTIRHGRDAVDGPVQASTANLALRRLDRGELPDWEVGGLLEVDDLDGRVLFTGQITDETLNDDDPRVDSVLSVIATSTLALAGRRNVGGHAWPAEPWAARMARILNEASLPGRVEPRSPDVPIAATVPTDPEAGYFESMDALTALEAGRDDVGATVFDDGDGTIVVQAFEGRRDLFPVLPLDPAVVLFAPPWEMTLDVANRVVMGYGYGAGSVTVDDPVSQTRYGLRMTGLFETGLADADAANERALAWLDRVAYPRWTLPGLTLLEPVDLHIGQMLQLAELPDSAPLPSWTPVVEGWVDQIEGPDWTQAVVLSDPILSGLALPWRDLPADLAWAEVDPACRWRDAYLLDNLTP